MYKLYKTLDGKDGVIYIGNGIQKSFLMNPDNTDYQEYLKWLDEGNTPEPADEV